MLKTVITTRIAANIDQVGHIMLIPSVQRRKPRLTEVEYLK